MVNQEWLNQFPNMVAHFHPEGLFDHCPCTVSNVALGDGKRANFKFFNMWGNAASFLPVITEEWQNVYPGHKMFTVIKKLKALKPALKRLNKDYYADIENSTTIVVAKLNSIQVQLAQDIQNPDLLQQEFETAATLKELTVAREFFEQKAKSQWLEAGDSTLPISMVQ
ncbi:uncharacterized protein LOC141613829 [Silene latifolia]|uniref:uncharacterized protein LOC141613829 n=1 Tax=Silene latifolia TaxID=37657 RepID=UPI003D76DCF6